MSGLARPWQGKKSLRALLTVRGVWWSWLGGPEAEAEAEAETEEEEEEEEEGAQRVVRSGR